MQQVIPEYEINFPFSQIRDAQKDAIEFALKAFFEEDKKFVVIEAGTGVGKSAIGLALSRTVSAHSAPAEFKPGGYFITTQKILQDQYLRDFGSPKGTMLSLKSSANFQCTYHKANTCADSLRALKVADKSSAFFKNCAHHCVYRQAKQAFISGEEGVTNFSYFLAETVYAGRLQPRRVLVVDEAHNADMELSKFIEIDISERFASTALKIEMPEIKTQHQAITWVREQYEPKLASHVKHMEQMLEKYVGLKDKLKEFTTVAKRFELLDKHICKVHRFLKIYDDENWIFNLIPAEGQAGRKLEFKPVDVSHYADEFLFRHGNKVILMSATILDKEGFCGLLGIKPEDCSFISIPSPFPVENKPILVSPVGSMSAGKIDVTLPRLANAVTEILRNHPNEKGIIHCHSYKIANYLMKNVKSARLLTHSSTDRDETLSKHIAGTQPTVLLSPSMTEGVDLKDDSSRFQVLCKVPYPYLGDKIVKKRMHRWPWWYPLQTAKTIVQSVGRSVRSETDHAVTYILDEDWDRFYSKNEKYFPVDFRESIVK